MSVLEVFNQFVCFMRYLYDLVHEREFKGIPLSSARWLSQTQTEPRVSQAVSTGSRQLAFVAPLSAPLRYNSSLKAHSYFNFFKNF